jgi:UDP-N-acetylmuramate: L-alanyl-gamma-D-glutamyl-meso-diaminopimelate ligase
LSHHIHILGICGTFMGGLALLAREAGFEVTGSDRNIYPPMSTQLADSGITLVDGYEAQQLSPAPDYVVVGNALSRGQPVVEAMLDQGLTYTSGPEWLGRHILQAQWVLAVSGTHGKTSTASMLAWILDCAGLEPGFLIGGVPGNFGVSARLGQGRFFVVEADEYDSAFFDKRSKFVHYRPKTLVINNIEFDHADIFADLNAIETQFHHLVRCVPGAGHIFCGPGEAIQRVLDRGCWSPVTQLGPASPGAASEGWRWRPLSEETATEGEDRAETAVAAEGAAAGTIWAIRSPEGDSEILRWPLIGEHNVANATAAIAAAGHVGVPFADAVAALASFAGVKRRLELLGRPAGVAVYDDFAHHPTAIRATLAAMRAQPSSGRVIALIEPRSNTMRSGEYKEELALSASDADGVLWYEPPGLDWNLGHTVGNAAGQEVFSSVAAMIERAVGMANSGDSIVVMSNGGFEGIHGRLLTALSEQ